MSSIHADKPAPANRAEHASRRATLGTLAQFAGMGIWFGSVPSMAAADEKAHGTEVLPDPREMAQVESAVDQALEYLIRHQQDDGSWPSGVGQGGKSNNGVNAICLLAFLGKGHPPNRGPYKKAVKQAVDVILATQTKEGLFLSPARSHGTMYEHGLATLAMIEAYGFIPTVDMRKRVQRAVDQILRAQNREGGWRYNPRPTDADLSVTVMQVVAIRAAINARLKVPETTTRNALKYVKRCAHNGGGFCYQPGQAPSMAQTSAGVLCMQLLGAFDDPRVAKGIKFLQRQRYHPDSDRYFCYMSYYSMQAHFQQGGAAWEAWHPKVKNWFIKTQAEDGSWPGYREEKINGRAKCYSTAMGAMTLEVFMHYLPAYQR